jgi:hypothetical protein
MQSQLWENDEMTDEEAELLEKQAVLLKIKMTRASEKVKQWGMETGLSRCAAIECLIPSAIYLQKAHAWEA